MFDIKWIRDNPDDFDAGLKKRGLNPMSAEVVRLDDARKSHIQTLQDAQERRNAASKAIGNAKASGDEAEAKRLIDEVADLKG
ncbi:MAG: serine--tRNA ligase, partial [Rhodobiaceae bacterium]|nr:serine--tRNA ligase [Rhodobiaceae bacterium]